MRRSERQDAQLCKLVTAAIRTHQPTKGSARCLRCNSRVEAIGAVRASRCGLCDMRGQHTVGCLNRCPRCSFDVCQSCSDEGTRTKPFSIDKLSPEMLIEAAAKHVPGNPLYSELQDVLGLTWRDAGGTPPPHGRELFNEQLADALGALLRKGGAKGLASMRAFTQEALMQLGVADLATDHYVAVGARYCVPEEGMPLEALAERYILLARLSDGAFKRLLPWVNLNEADVPSSVAFELCSLRSRLFFERKEPLFRDALKATRNDVRREALLVFSLNRIKALEARDAAATATEPPLLRVAGQAGGAGGGAGGEAGGGSPAGGEAQRAKTIFEQLSASLFKDTKTPAERLWALYELGKTHRTNEGGSRSASTSLAFSVSEIAIRGPSPRPIRGPSEGHRRATLALECPRIALGLRDPGVPRHLSLAPSPPPTLAPSPPATSHPPPPSLSCAGEVRGRARPRRGRPLPRDPRDHRRRDCEPAAAGEPSRHHLAPAITTRRHHLAPRHHHVATTPHPACHSSISRPRAHHPLSPCSAAA